MTSAAGVLSGVLPPDRLVTGPAAESWSVAGHAPGAVAFPESVEEVAAVLARASDESLRTVAAGRGTALCVQGLSTAPDLVLSTERMAAVTEYEPADLTVTAQAGLTLGALDAITREHGQWLPLDPPGGEDGTLGALLATASAGPLQAEFGTPRDHVLGLTLVTGDGRILEVGGRVVKNVAGYDLVRLAVGSGGTLGVITGATLRLHPLPEADAALVLEGSSLEALAPSARGLATAPVTVSSLELVEPWPAEGKGAALVARLVGAEEAVGHALEVLTDRLDLPSDLSPEVIRGARVRELFRSLSAREAGDLVLRMTLLPGALDELLETGRQLVRAWSPPNIRPSLAAHVTRGRLRLAVSNLPSGPEAIEGLAGAVAAARETLDRRGGSLRIVAGPSGLLSAFALGAADEGVVRLVSGIKDVFDPRGVLPRGGVTP